MVTYNLAYFGAVCTGVEWGNPNKFYIMYCGVDFEFTQQHYVSCSVDTDHIKLVIKEQFFPWFDEWRSSNNLRYKRNPAGEPLELDYVSNDALKIVKNSR